MQNNNDDNTTNNADTKSYKIRIDIEEAKSKLQYLSTTAHNANVALTALTKTIRTLRNNSL